MKYIKNIGRGGFGVVDLVENETGQQFAQKTFRVNQPDGFGPELTENVRKRFVREAKVQSNINHKNIVPIVASQLVGDTPAFLMPLAASSLGDDIKLDKNIGGNAISAVMDILAGLEELHALGITHRDLKPQNVLRLFDGSAYYYAISDFGLMSIKDTQLSVLTETGMHMGSDFYTAPEIVTELKLATPRSDIYSVGCILHDLFGTKGRIPCNEIIESGSYGHIMQICTRKDPTRRFQSVSSLRDAILSTGQVPITASAPKINHFIALLQSGNPIDLDTWEKIVDEIENIYPSPDCSTLLSQISLDKITEVLKVAPNAAARLGTAYSTWVKDTSFDFGDCDGVANRLQEFLASDDLTCKADVLLALLLMGTSHNRWYVQRKFTSNCDANMEHNLARRIAMEIRVMERNACWAISHLETSIGFNRISLHPDILLAINQVCV